MTIEELHILYRAQEITRRNEDELTVNDLRSYIFSNRLAEHIQREKNNREYLIDFFENGYREQHLQP